MKKLMRIIIFSCVPLFAILILLELGGRVYHYQIRSSHNFALEAVYDKACFYIKRKMAEAKIKRVRGKLNDMTYEKLLSCEEGVLLLEEYKNKYDDYFAKLVNEVLIIDAVLLGLYIPSNEYNSIEYKYTSKFFDMLFKKHGILLVDLSNDFAKYERESVTLRPKNGHLSRFGNKIVAAVLSNTLNKFGNHKSHYHFQEHPEIMGDLSPRDDSIWVIAKDMPYRVITNKQGFRMAKELKFPKEKQRILILGDSFTFGPYLDNHDTYPSLLQAKHFDKEIINAGVAGYTIFDEESLFRDRAKYVEPDIVILQVLSNDLLPGMTTNKLNMGNREKVIFEYSENEKRFLTRNTN